MVILFAELKKKLLNKNICTTWSVCVTALKPTKLSIYTLRFTVGCLDTSKQRRCLWCQEKFTVLKYNCVKSNKENFLKGAWHTVGHFYISLWPESGVLIWTEDLEVVMLSWWISKLSRESVYCSIKYHKILESMLYFLEARAGKLKWFTFCWKHNKCVCQKLL